jgi:hypothetical protein
MASNDLLLLKTKVQYLWHTYLWPPIPWHRKAMDKEIIKAIATKFSEIFATSMLKKHRKFCRRGLTHLDATSTFQKSFRSFWDTLYVSKNWRPILPCYISGLSHSVCGFRNLLCLGKDKK